MIILIAISLMISNVFATCDSGATPPTIDNGKCCGKSTGAIPGPGAQTCATETSPTADANALTCLQGYLLNAGVCERCGDGLTAPDGSTLTTCTACPANFFCDNDTNYGTVNVAPVACPANSESPASSDQLADCVCTDKTKTLDTTSNTAGCVSTYTGAGGNCSAFAVATADTCTRCRDGYYLNGKICSACATNCKVCSSGTVCTTANDGYYINSNAPAACATNCKVCSSNTVCTTANDGYYINANAPAACATNCKVCSSNTVCTTANDGYYLQAGAPVACPPNTTRCTSSDGTVIVVTGVLANFYVQIGATNQATACTAGTSSLATAVGVTAVAAADNTAGCPISCSAGCSTCSTNGATFCDVCQVEFLFDSTTKLCTAINDNNRHASCATATGLTAANCVSCRDTDNRILVKAAETDATGTCTCQPAFTESGQTDAVKFPTLSDRSACVACGKGVATCQSASDAKPLEPITCTDKTQLIVGNICAATTEKIDFLYYDSTDQQFVPCDDSCQSCAAKGPGACIVCQDLPAVSGLEQTDETTLLKAWTNGTLPATGGTCYSQCPTGYGIEDDTRVNCVQSSTQIISMIAVFISFIFLI